MTCARHSVKLVLNAPQKIDVAYDAANRSITVLLNDQPIGLDNIPLGSSLSELVGGDTAIFGLTAGQGVIHSTIDVADFSAEPAVPEPVASSLLLVITALTATRSRRIATDHCTSSLALECANEDA
jgi:hypothetical protein